MRSLQATILAQLHRRLDPPIPDSLIMAAERAVRLCAAGDAHRRVEIEGGPSLPAGSIVYALELEDLIP